MPQDITIDVHNTATQYNGGVNFSYPLILTRKKQLGLTGGFDYTDRRNDYRLRARGFGQTLDLPSENQHVRYPALEFGLNGYRDGEATDDYGYGGQIEMRYLHMRPESKWLSTVQPYVLADAARTGFNQPGYHHPKLASVAGGVMLGDMRHYGLTLEAARPVGDKPSDASRRDWRFSLTVTWNFNDLR